MDIGKYVESIFKKDMEIEQLARKLKDKDYNNETLEIAHNAMLLREKRQNEELLELQGKYNLMTDMCRNFELTLNLISKVIAGHINSGNDSSSLENDYRKIIKDHNERIIKG